MSKALLFSGDYFQPLDAEGKLIPNGTLEVLNSVDGTYATVYANSEMTVTQPNPVPLDGAGKALIFLEEGNQYDLILKDETGATVRTISNFYPFGFDTVTYVSTVEDMLDYPVGSQSIMVTTSGRKAVNDGGGGTFVWYPNNSSTVDGGTVLQSNKTTVGRWLRINYTFVKPEFFDYDTSDWSSAINAALKHYYVRFTKYYNYTIENTISLALNSTNYTKLRVIDWNNAKFTFFNGTYVMPGSYAGGFSKPLLFLGFTQDLTTTSGSGISAAVKHGDNKVTATNSITYGRYFMLKGTNGLGEIIKSYSNNSLTTYTTTPILGDYTTSDKLAYINYPVTAVEFRGELYIEVISGSHDVGVVYQGFFDTNLGSIHINGGGSAIPLLALSETYNVSINVDLSTYNDSTSTTAAALQILNSTYVTVKGKVSDNGTVLSTTKPTAANYAFDSSGINFEGELTSYDYSKTIELGKYSLNNTFSGRFGAVTLKGGYNKFSGEIVTTLSGLGIDGTADLYNFSHDFSNVKFIVPTGATGGGTVVDIAASSSEYVRHPSDVFNLSGIEIRSDVNVDSISFEMNDPHASGTINLTNAGVIRGVSFNNSTTYKLKNLLISGLHCSQHGSTWNITISTIKGFNNISGSIGSVEAVQIAYSGDLNPDPLYPASQLPSGYGSIKRGYVVPTVIWVDASSSANDYKAHYQQALGTGNWDDASYIPYVELEGSGSSSEDQHIHVIMDFYLAEQN